MKSLPNSICPFGGKCTGKEKRLPANGQPCSLEPEDTAFQFMKYIMAGADILEIASDHIHIFSLLYRLDCITVRGLEPPGTAIHFVDSTIFGDNFLQIFLQIAHSKPP